MTPLATFIIACITGLLGLVCGMQIGRANGRFEIWEDAVSNGFAEWDDQNFENVRWKDGTRMKDYGDIA